MRHSFPTSALLSLALLAAPAAFAATVSGTVHDGTTNKPSAGDDVILISLQQRMQETARTKTDAKGAYTLEIPDQGFHLIRVDHQKASYFQPAPPNASKVDIQVYDVAATVPGITTEASVLRMETNPQGLRVTQSYFVKNDSTPPRTQFSSHSYDIFLPPDAKIEGAAAMGPGGMPVASSPAPTGEKGHYAYLFPLRPGETQFQVTYSLPYTGSMQFTPRLATAADNVVVIVPKSMTFKAAAGTPYQPINDDINAQTYVAKAVKPTQALGFAISGSGSLPRDVQTPQQQAAAAQAGAQGPAGQPGENPTATQDNRPGGGLGNPIDTPDPLSKYKWWILGGVGLLLAIAAAFFLRRPAAPAEEASTSFNPPLNPAYTPAADERTRARFDDQPQPDPLFERERMAEEIRRRAAEHDARQQNRGYADPDSYSRTPSHADPDRYTEQRPPDRYSEPDRYAGTDRYAEPDRYPESARYAEPERSSSVSPASLASVNASVPQAAGYRSPAATAAPVPQRDALLAALKEELFALETDRAQGTIGEVEYATYKQALETVIRRAVGR